VAVIPAGLAGVVSLPTRVSVNVIVRAGQVRSAGGGRLASGGALAAAGGRRFPRRRRWPLDSGPWKPRWISRTCAHCLTWRVALVV